MRGEDMPQLEDDNNVMGSKNVAGKTVDRLDGSGCLNGLIRADEQLPMAKADTNQTSYRENVRIT